MATKETLERRPMELETLREAVNKYLNGREAGETDEQWRSRQRFLEGRMVGLTEGLDEHPDFMNEVPCLCDSCRSYDC